MSEFFRPMLATDADIERVKFPLLASPKLDGIRAVIQGGQVVSRSGKPIPNKHVQRLFANCPGLDGELIVGDPREDDAYRKTMSGVMSVEGEPDVKFHVFDHVAQPTLPFKNRLRFLHMVDYTQVEVVPQLIIETYHQLEICEEEHLNEGYEGLILRSFESPYKFGRSTVREGGMLKLKRFKDGEAIITGFKERMHNANELTEDELGYAKRSSHVENMVGRGDLGALEVTDGEMSFSIGTGFDDVTRSVLWANRANLVGKIVKYKFFPSGSKDAPRFPVFMGFRSEHDS